MGVKGTDEFQLVLDDIGLKGNKGASVQQAFLNSFIARLDLTNNMQEDTATAMQAQVSKKLPLNMQLADESLQCSNPKLVDVEWDTIYSINGKNISRLLQPRFIVTLSLLCQGELVKGGASEQVQTSAKRNQLKLKRVKFECTYSEMQHLHFKVKHACNAIQQIIKPPKQSK